MHTYDGILFIGDPHVSSMKPGRRKEDNFLDVSLNKLSQSIAYGRENNLLMVCLGDLLDREGDFKTLVPLLRLLKHNNVRVLLGNHDVKSSSNIHDKAVITALVEAEAIIPWFKPGLQEVVELKGGHKVSLFGYPYGSRLPTELDEGEGTRIMVTHHDLNFGIGKQYPGTDKIYPVEGCDLVINGHQHDYKPIQEVGTTLWFNPGNILRQSVDLRDHKPAVFAWYPQEQENGDPVCRNIVRHELVHSKDVFDMTGYNVEASQESSSSAFVKMMRDQESSMDMEQSDDAGVVKEEMEKLFAVESPSEDVREILKGLIDNVVDKRQEEKSLLK